MNSEHILTIIYIIAISFAAGGYAIFSLLREDIRKLRRQLVNDMIFMYDRAIKEMEGE